MFQLIQSKGGAQVSFQMTPAVDGDNTGWATSFFGSVSPSVGDLIYCDSNAGTWIVRPNQLYVEFSGGIYTLIASHNTARNPMYTKLRVIIDGVSYEQAGASLNQTIGGQIFTAGVPVNVTWISLL